MGARLARMADKTSSAPFFANAIHVRNVPRFRPFDFFDIVAVVGGEGRQISYPPSGRPRTRPLRPGTMVLYRPVDDVRLTGMGPDGMDLKYVSFPAAEWTTFANMVGVDPAWSTSPEPPRASFDPADRDALRPLDTAIDRFLARPSSLDLVRFWIDVIPMMFPESHPRLPGAGAPLWLVDGVEAMRAEENLRRGLPRLLELAHVTAPHLSVTTRRFFGKTPTELVLELRLRHAAILLATTADSVGGIAQRCGFKSFAYFSTSFRRQHQLTPREYRTRSIGRFVRLAQSPVV
jgi:AraC-like DNA-binding protein